MEHLNHIVFITAPLVLFLVFSIGSGFSRKKVIPIFLLSLTSLSILFFSVMVHHQLGRSDASHYCCQDVVLTFTPTFRLPLGSEKKVYLRDTGIDSQNSPRLSRVRVRSPPIFTS